MGRVASLDTGRVVAVLAVLTLHARLRRQFFGGDLHGWERVAEVAADHACRFAVPFFFFVSGYLLARSAPPRSTERVSVAGGVEAAAPEGGGEQGGQDPDGDLVVGHR